jgi:hypothetical protein
MRTTGLLLFAFALAACSQMRWQKADGGDATLARDLSACRKQAQAMYGAPGSFTPSSQLDPRFGPTGPGPAEQRMQESQAEGQCMRQRGYVLVPA